LSVRIRPITPTLRRDGSDHSPESAGKVKACAFATSRSSVHAYRSSLTPGTRHLKGISGEGLSVFIHISSPGLLDASDPIADGGSAPQVKSRSCIRAAATSWTTRVSKRPRDRHPRVDHAAATKGD